MTSIEPLSIGIRYGYDYSMIAYYDTKARLPVIIKDENDNQTIQSCLYVEDCEDNPEEIAVYFGNQAIEFGEENVLRGITPTNKNVYSFNSSNQSSQQFSREDVTYHIINHLLQKVKEKVGDKDIGRVCLSVPYDLYGNRQKELTDACVKAGIKRENVEIIHTVATTLMMYKRCYDKFSKKGLLRRENTIVVVDLNEDGIDCFCCRLVTDDIDDKNYIDSVLKVVTRTHDESVSGKRIKIILGELIFRKINEILKADNKREIDYDEFFSINQMAEGEEVEEKLNAINHFWNEVEIAKKRLWKGVPIPVSPPHFLQGCDPHLITSGMIKKEDAIEVLEKEGVFEKIEKIIKACVNQTGLKRKKINHCLFMGETAAAPFFKENILSRFPRDTQTTHNEEIYKFLLESVDVEAATYRANYMK